MHLGYRLFANDNFTQGIFNNKLQPYLVGYSSSCSHSSYRSVIMAKTTAMSPFWFPTWHQTFFQLEVRVENVGVDTCWPLSRFAVSDLYTVHLAVHARPWCSWSFLHYFLSHNETAELNLLLFSFIILHWSSRIGATKRHIIMHIMSCCGSLWRRADCLSVLFCCAAVVAAIANYY